MFSDTGINSNQSPFIPTFVRNHEQQRRCYYYCKIIILLAKAVAKVDFHDPKIRILGVVLQHVSHADRSAEIRIVGTPFKHC